MKRLQHILFRVVLAAFLAAGVVSSCDERHPVDVVVTDYAYTFDVEDVPLGTCAECVVTITGGARDEGITLQYKIDDDLSLRLSVNGTPLQPGSSVVFDITGQLHVTLPQLSEGRHVLHLVLTNKYGKSVSKDLPFNVIRDRIPASFVTAPAYVSLLAGFPMDTLVSIAPADADDMELHAVSSDENVVTASLEGNGADKTLHLVPGEEGSASVTLHHRDIDGIAATVLVDVYSYHIAGLADTVIVEGGSFNVTVEVTPQVPVQLVSSSSCVEIDALGGNTFRIRAVLPGEAVLTATAGNTRTTCVVTVKKKDETIYISPMSVLIGAGQIKTFSIVSSGDWDVSLSDDAARVIERSATSVTVRNDNGGYVDKEVVLTATNLVDPSKQAISHITLERRAETVVLETVASRPGILQVAVGGANGGWEVTSAPYGLTYEVQAGAVILRNDTYKAVSGRLAVQTKTQGVEATLDVKVEGLDVVLSSIAVSPSEFETEVGSDVTLAVTATYSDGTTKDVTTDVSWTQSTNLARSGAAFTALSAGPAWIRAAFGGLAAEASGTIKKKPVVLSSLAVEPSRFAAVLGETRAFSAIATFSDGATRDVTLDAKWSARGAEMVDKGYFRMNAVGEAIIDASWSYEDKEASARSQGSITKTTKEIASVTISPTAKTLVVGESATFIGTVLYKDGSSDHSGDFTVTPAGILSGTDGTYTAVAEGSATVTFRYAGYSASAVVTVQSDNIPVTGVNLDQSSLTMAVGDTRSLFATVSPTNASNAEVTWSSSDEKTVSVSASGLLRALKGGSAVITVRTVDGGFTATCAVTVTSESDVLRSLKIEAPQQALFAGGSMQLRCVGTYGDGSTKDLTAKAAWSSSDVSVAEVSAAGRVTARKSGFAEITAGVESLTSSLVVTVEDASVESIAAEPVSLSMKVGDTKDLSTISVTAVLSDGSRSMITSGLSWISSNPAVAEVSSSVLAGQATVKAKAEGTAVLTVSFEGRSAAVTVTVANDIESLVVEPASLSLKTGETRDLSSDVSVMAVMSDGSRHGVTSGLSWTSSNSSVAEVSSSVMTGQATVKAKAEGIATLTVTHGGKNASLFVSVANSIIYVESVSLDREAVTLSVGATATLNATVLPADATDKTLAWESAAPAVAAVDGSGKITALKAGFATVSAASRDGSGKSASCVVTVLQPVTDVILDRSAATIEEGGTLALTATVLPADASNKDLGWTSSNAGVAAVDENGIVDAVHEGTAVITAAAKDGSGKKATCRITVLAKVIPVQQITLDQDKLSVNVGATAVLHATVLPADASDKSVEWSSSDASVATVDAFGVVTGRSAGLAVVRAASRDDSGKSASCVVTVLQPVTGISLDRTSVMMEEGSSEVLHATVLPADASDKSVEWSSSNASVAAVDENGVVDAVHEGTAVITAAAKDGSQVKATCSVRITAKTVHVTGVTLDRQSVILTEGETAALTAKIIPENATDRSVSWSSNDISVATVSGSGIVTARREGSAIVTVVTTDGGKSATCVIGVKAKAIPVTSVSVSPSSLSLPVGGTQTLTASVNPSDATNRAVEWHSSNTSVVTVSAGGFVSAVGAGTATVTATAKDGSGKSGSCSIRVTEPQHSIVASPSSLSWTWDSRSSKTSTLTLTNVASVTLAGNSGDYSLFSFSVSGKTVTVTPKAQNTKSRALSATLRVSETGNGDCYTIIQLSQDARPESRLTSISVTPASVSPLSVGGTVTLSAQCRDQYGDLMDAQVSWNSANTSVATVSSGLVTAVSPGTTTIWAYAYGASGMVQSNEVSVTVNPTLVTSVSVSPSTLTLSVGQGAPLQASVQPSNATNKAVRWTSAGEGIAAVSSSGYVTARGPGEVNITATAADGSGKSAFCRVKVLQPVTNIRLDETDIVLNVGESSYLTATVEPSNASDKSVEWISGNSSVVTVDGNGRLKAVGKGTTTITVRAKDGSGVYATCSVTVRQPATSVVIKYNGSEITEMLSVDKGSSLYLTAVVGPTGADQSVTWSSSDESVATVGSSGQVTGRKAGEARITATAADGSGVSASCRVKVLQPVTGVALNRTSLSLNVDETETLTATISPTDASDKTLEWSSSDESVATVSSSGQVTGRKAGEARITVKAHGGKYATCSVTVSQPATSVAIKYNGAEVTSPLSVNKNGRLALSAEVYPSSASQSVTWSSSDESVATVSSSGQVTGRKAGEATVTATAADGSGVSASCRVRVLQPVTGISVNPSSLSLSVGETSTLTAAVSPDDASDKTLEWSSSNESVATVDGTGRVRAVVRGTATVTVRAKDGSGVYATCSVSVKQPAESVTILYENSPVSEEITVNKGSSLYLSAEVYPSSANQSVTWSSSDASVATVDNYGVVAGRKAGEATVTATAADGSGVSASCRIKVLQPVTGVALDKTTLALSAGSTATLKATVSPSDATNKTVVWSSADESVAVIDQEGTVTAVGNGQAYVTASSEENGRYKASCLVTVTTPVENVSIWYGDEDWSGTTHTVYTDEPVMLEAKVSPSTASNKKVSWKSANTGKVSVSGNGLVSVSSVFSSPVKVTATAEDGGASAEVWIMGGQKTRTIEIVGGVQQLTWAPDEKHVQSVNVQTQNLDGIRADISGSGFNTPSVSALGDDLFRVSISPKTTGGGLSARLTIQGTFNGSVVSSATQTIDLVQESLRLQTLIVSPASVDIPWRGKDNDAVLLVTAKDQLGNDFDITGNVYWTVNGPSGMVTVRNDSFDKYRATLKSWSKAETGTAQVMASYGGVESNRITVNVVADEEHVTDIKLKASKTTIKEGETTTVTATITPDYATNKTLSWESSDHSVATVDHSGVVKGAAGTDGGEVTITATATDGSGKSGSCKVTVTPLPHGIAIFDGDVDVTGGSVTKSAGKAYTFRTEMTPSGVPSEDQGVIWSSSNTSVATVSSGQVRCIKAGEATVTATAASNQSVTASFTVNVVQSVTGVSISPSSLSVNKGSSAQLTATVEPSNATNKDVSWYSEDSSVATVDQSGRVTGRQAGSTRISVRTADGGFVAQCDVTVTIPVTGIDLSSESLMLVQNSYEIVEVSVKPLDATNRQYSVFTSNNLVTVSETNTPNTWMVTSGSAAGECDITFTTDDGSHSAVCHVTVSLLSSAYSISPALPQSITLKVGEKYNLSDYQYNVVTRNRVIVWGLSACAIVPNSDSPKKRNFQNGFFKIESLNSAAAAVEESDRFYIVGRTAGETTNVNFMARKSESDMNYFSFFSIQVKVVDAPKSIRFTDTKTSSKSIDLEEGTMENISVEVLNLNGAVIADPPEITWTVTNGNDKVKISGSGPSVSVQGLKEGSATVVVSCDEAQTATLNVNVSRTPAYIIFPDNNSDTQSISVEEGKEVEVNVSVLDQKRDKIVNPTGVSWSVADGNVASIVGQGTRIRVHGNREGFTTATVTCQEAIPATLYIIVMSKEDSEPFVSGLEPDINGNEFTVSAIWEDPVSGDTWTEDVTNKVTISTTGSTKATCVPGENDGTWVIRVTGSPGTITLEYGGESLTLTVKSVNGQIMIY